MFPITILTYLWSQHSVSPWLLAVSSFYIKIIIKVLVSLAVYSLFLIDEYCTKSWEKFDDYVYNIKSFGTTVILEILNIYFLILWLHFVLNIMVIFFILGGIIFWHLFFSE